VAHHRRGLRRLLADDDLAERIEADWTSAGLDPRRTAIAHYALRLTRSPGSVEREHVEALRAVGLDDRGILQLAEVVAYYAFVNRIADGLGVALESDHAR
jgi:uncharacterized peroxidase-related enzyme